MARAESIARWMRQQMTAAGARGLVVGMSGDLDSTVVARLAQLAAPSSVLAVLLPCHSDPTEEADAAAVAAHFSLPTTRIDLSSTYDGLMAASVAAMKTLPGRQPTESVNQQPIANIKPRLRMTAMYFLANSLN